MRMESVSHLVNEKSRGISMSCHLMGVARSCFYSAKSRPMRASVEVLLHRRIRFHFEKNKRRYGSPRITSSLRDEGFCVGENKVAELMREMGLRATQKASYRPRTTVNDPDSKKAERVFKITETEVAAPDQVWASDLTYLPFSNRFLYLVVFIDLFTRKVKSWELASNMKAHHTKRAFLGAVANTNGSLSGLVSHSDQGVQYCWGEYQSTLEFLSVTQSMSRRGNCYDNAFAESFFATLKRELDLSHCKTELEMKEEIAEYINWYNNERKHSSLGQKSPAEFESTYEAFTA